MKLWGLTGGIASGKSTVAQIFSEAGVPVLDADQISRELRSEGGAAHPLILKRFGTSHPTQLRDLVFSDAQARKDLEEILHPLIIKESQERAQRIADQSPDPENSVLIYEAALLVETGRYRELSGLIVVTAPEELRIKRLMHRDGISQDLASQILAAQLPEEKRKAVADLIIDNSQDLEFLRKQTLSVLQSIRSRYPI